MSARGYHMDGPRAGGPSLLARQIGVHRATISRILNQGTIPTPPTLEAIATQLGVPKAEILIAAGIARPDELASQPPDPDPDEIFPGGLRDQHERTIWGMTALPWQARQAAIDAMRKEARRMATENATSPRSGQRPA
jgi:transcriptional regulator with XRE-family HTH domain